MMFPLAVVAFVIVGVAVAQTTLPNQRPSYDKRTFHSAAIDNLISTLQPLFRDANLGTLFANCLPNTLDTTVYSYTANPEATAPENLDSFVITGDIDALWLRDSMNQLLPYAPYSSEDSGLQYLFEGLINRHAKSVLIDPFANAFNFNASGAGHQSDQRTPPMTRSVFEGKYEIDSLAAFLKLSYWYQRFNPDALLRFGDSRWLSAVDTLLSTVETMQKDTGASANAPYKFRRETTEALDTLSMQGRGPPAHPNGLTRSLFRPSDDAVTLPYNVPGNAMMCVELTHLGDMLAAVRRRGGVAAKTFDRDQLDDLIAKTQRVQSALCSALLTFTTATRPASQDAAVVPFEVDGFGGAYYMDDANIPSLLSLPVLGYMSRDHPNYRATRDFVLSAQNPFFFAGTAAQGVGGPHVGFNYSWPMAIAMRAMTATSTDEIQSCLQLLATTTAGTGLMHESFNVNNANDFTRSWFAWANGVFGEFLLQVLHTQPELLVEADAVPTVRRVVKPTVSWLAQREALVR
eukprot:gene4821-3456_t